MLTAVARDTRGIMVLMRSRVSGRRTKNEEWMGVCISCGGDRARTIAESEVYEQDKSSNGQEGRCDVVLFKPCASKFRVDSQPAIRQSDRILVCNYLP